MYGDFFDNDQSFLSRIDDLIDFNKVDLPAIEEFPSRFINRELSWLEFNERVLEEARDSENPLFERLNFLSITGSNLDEFFMIRVASLKDQYNAGYTLPDPAGLLPEKQLELISDRTHEMVRKQYSTLLRSIVPALEKNRIEIINPSELNPAQKDYVKRYFESTVFPVLTPLAVAAGSPFPLIANKTINLIVRVEIPTAKNQKGQRMPFAVVQIPAILPRLLQLPSEEGDGQFILLEDVVSEHINRLFSGVKIGTISCFRIMRNADLDIDDEDAADLLSEIETQVRQRRWGEVIRLEIQSGYDEEILPILTENFEISDRDLYEIPGPLDLTFLSKLPSFFKDRQDLFYPPFTPQPSPAFYGKDDYFSVIREKDVILNHPYEDFDTVIELIRRAAEDPNVLAIKQTLYRVGGQSPIITSLADAAIRGKQVLVLVELRARFDEENNIQWAKKLEQAGCHVIYGLVGLKTHSKITLIVRNEEDGIRRYVHLATGNYNETTAKIYTDLGLLTCSEPFGRDATDFFNMISGYSMPLSWRKLIPAPKWLRIDTLNRIEQEIKNAREGKPAAIVAKINSLVDPEIIDALYRASQAEVRITLIVRGICCLRPGIKNLSENIHVRSIVGRYLEHSRIIYFYNDGQEDLFLSSADWMPRNLDRRIELQFPIEEKSARMRVFHVLYVQLMDTDRARIMEPDGTYHRVDRRRKEAFDSQVRLCHDAIEAAASLNPEPRMMDRYIPSEVNATAVFKDDK